MRILLVLTLILCEFFLHFPAFAQPVDGCYLPPNNTYPENWAEPPPAGESEIVIALAGDSNSTNLNYTWIRGAAASKFAYSAGSAGPYRQIHTLNMALAGSVAASTHPIPNIPEEWTGDNQVAAALAYKPSILIIALGTNDLIFSRTPQQAFTDIQNLVKAAKLVAQTLNFALRTAVVSIPEVTGTFLSQRPDMPDKISELNQLLREEFEPSGEFIDPDHDLSTDYHDDGLHIIEAGHDRRARSYAEHFAPQGTDVFDPDTDGDRITDYMEFFVIGTNPLDADSDDDGLSDHDEVLRDTNPREADTDGDGIQDGTEVGVTALTSVTAGLSDCAKVPFHGTDEAVFKPDLCPSDATDPLLVRSPGNEEDDGQQDANGDGCEDIAPTPTPSSSATTTATPSAVPTSTPDGSPTSIPTVDPTPVPDCEAVSFTSNATSLKTLTKQLILALKRTVNRGSAAQCSSGSALHNRINTRKRASKKVIKNFQSSSEECFKDDGAQCDWGSLEKKTGALQKQARFLKNTALKALRSCEHSKSTRVKLKQQILESYEAFNYRADSYQEDIVRCTP